MKAQSNSRVVLLMQVGSDYEDSTNWTWYGSRKENSTAKVNCPVNDHIQEDLDSDSGRYDEQVARNVVKWAKGLQL